MVVSFFREIVRMRRRLKEGYGLKEKKIPGAVPEKGKNLRVLSKLEDFYLLNYLK